jgi:hypothetical protein
MARMAGGPAAGQITTWLTQWRRGDAAAAERLFSAVQPRLEQMAAGVLRTERTHHTLEPDALVNELYVRWLGESPVAFADRVHFFARAAKTMRRILIDHARARSAGKRGGDRDRVTLSAIEGGIRKRATWTRSRWRRRSRTPIPAPCWTTTNMEGESRRSDRSCAGGWRASRLPSIPSALTAGSRWRRGKHEYR